MAEKGRKLLKNTRLPFVPTDEQRSKVEALYAYGAPQDDICEFIVNPNSGKSIKRDTLAKHFASELKLGKWKVVSEAAQNLLQSARGRPAVYDAQNNLVRAERPPDTTAAIFICKALGKWQDRVAHDHSGKIEGGTRTVYLLPGDDKV